MLSGHDGLVVMPTFTYDNETYAPDLPGRTGALAEAFRRRPDALRSSAPDILGRGRRNRRRRSPRRARTSGSDRRRQPARTPRRRRRARPPARCRPHGEHHRPRGRIPGRRAVPGHPVRPRLAGAWGRSVPRVQPGFRGDRTAAPRAGRDPGRKGRPRPRPARLERDGDRGDGRTAQRRSDFAPLHRSRRATAARGRAPDSARAARAPAAAAGHGRSAPRSCRAAPAAASSLRSGR